MSDSPASDPPEMITSLIQGRIDPDEVLRMQREKDPGRFEAVLAAEQARLSWPDPILVCLQEHLYVVARDSAAGDGVTGLVKCSCGQEFGDYQQNWKEGALVYEREPADGEVFLPGQGADPDWQLLREFYCPGCATLLDVEPVPVGYPFIFNFLPDLGD